MNILIIGGSNSVISDGYVMHFKRAMEERSDITSIYNVAVGGTTSLTCIGLLDSLKNTSFDIIIFEYSLNDTGHLNHRPEGKMEKRLMLEIVFSYLKKYFSKAIVVPLILASEPFYRISVNNVVYDAEIEFYNELRLEYLDTRKEFYSMFGDDAPYFLYSDYSHFHRGFASALIGRLLAQTIRIATATQSTIGEIGSDYIVYKGSRKMVVDYCESKVIAQINNKSSEMIELSNRHMSLNCLNISTEEVISIPKNTMPMCIYIASDQKHSKMCVSNKKTSMHFSTKYTDIREGKFIFTSIPLFLLENFNFEIDDEYNLQVEKEETHKNPVSIFDCFDEVSFQHPTYANIVGILSLKNL